MIEALAILEILRYRGLPIKPHCYHRGLYKDNVNVKSLDVNVKPLSEPS